MSKRLSVLAAWTLGLTFWHSALAQLTGDVAVQNQWFTGSLEAPSPALPKAGILALEPYFIYTSITGSYANSGAHLSSLNDVNEVASIVAVKYAITDRLTVQALPSVAHVWNSQVGATGSGDLPLELEYRVNDENNRTGFPSLTAAFGLTLPIGAYEHLHSPIDGLGSGAWTLKQGLLLQSLFDTWGGHPMRFRLYGAAFEPFEKVPVRDISVYGTDQGYQGRVTPGFASEFGIGAGYAFNQRVVLALDVVENLSSGFRLSGTEPAKSALTTRAPNSANLAVATAMEYNWSDNIGVIAGVEFTVSGRNSSAYFAPQVALSMSF